MARDPPLVDPAPTAQVAGKVHIGHVQLRDLIICPREAGVVNYVQNRAIVEHDVGNQAQVPRVIADTSFIANTLTSLPINGTDTYLLAAGGQDAQIHLSLQRSNKTHTTLADVCLPGSINNSVLLTSLNLSHSHQSSAEPRIGISNNDCTFRFYDIALRTKDASSSKMFKEVGSIKLDVPINHSSISPDGRTLLSAGDSNKVYLHHLSGSSRVSFTLTSELSLPPCPNMASFSDHSSLTASFSTAFSANGSKFAVASQEGIVVVWDVRSSKPLKTYVTDRDRRGSMTPYNPGSAQDASGWLSDDPWEWTRGHSRAPGWSVRSLKFGTDKYGGKEVLSFTEHTSVVHVVDAQTFENHQRFRMPHIARPASPSDTQREDSIARMDHNMGMRTTTSPGPIPPHLERALGERSSQAERNYQGGPRPRTRHRPYQLRSSLPLPTFSSPQESIQSLRNSLLAANDSGNLRPQQRLLNALEDTFRVSPRLHRALSQDALEEEDPSNFAGSGDAEGRGEDMDGSEDVIVIPPLGDRAVEADVRALFGSHGLRTRQATILEDIPMGDDEGSSSTFLPSNSATAETAHENAAMETDELESDYCASHTPSRSSSPSPPANNNNTTVNVSSSPASSASTQRFLQISTRRASDATATAYARERERQREREREREREEIDLAGVCFDPAGKYLYVASTEGVAEWRVNGREKRWWGDIDDGWA